MIPPDTLPGWDALPRLHPQALQAWRFEHKYFRIVLTQLRYAAPTSYELRCIPFVNSEQFSADSLFRAQAYCLQRVHAYLHEALATLPDPSAAPPPAADPPAADPPAADPPAAKPPTEQPMHSSLLQIFREIPAAIEAYLDTPKNATEIPLRRKLTVALQFLPGSTTSEAKAARIDTLLSASPNIARYLTAKLELIAADFEVRRLRERCADFKTLQLPTQALLRAHHNVSHWANEVMYDLIKDVAIAEIVISGETRD